MTMDGRGNKIDHLKTKKNQCCILVNAFSRQFISGQGERDVGHAAKRQPLQMCSKEKRRERKRYGKHINTANARETKPLSRLKANME